MDPARKKEILEGTPNQGMMDTGAEADAMDALAGPDMREDPKMALGHAKNANVSARGDAALAVPANKRTAQQKQDIKNFIRRMGTPTKAWEAEELGQGVGSILGMAPALKARPKKAKKAKKSKKATVGMKHGGKVRGAGIARKGVRPCRMV